MKIAVATENDQVATHFGRCPAYTLATVHDGDITSEATLRNPGHEPGVLPGYLAEHGVDVVMSGGMGVRAQKHFAEAGIQCIVGVTGPVKEALRAYLAGTLRPGNDRCLH